MNLFSIRFPVPSITLSISKHFESIFKHSGGETCHPMGSIGPEEGLAVRLCYPTPELTSWLERPPSGGHLWEMFSLDGFSFVTYLFFPAPLDQSDSFFHFQCLECPALVDRPCVGGCTGIRYCQRKLTAKCCRV